MGGGGCTCCWRGANGVDAFAADRRCKDEEVSTVNGVWLTKREQQVRGRER